MSRALRTGLAALWGIGAFLNFSLYAAKPELKNIALVKNEAEYVQLYEGPSPAEALDHALASLDVVEASNPKYVQDIQALETELVQYKTEINTLLSGQVDYQDLSSVSGKLDTASSELETFAKNHSKNNENLGLGIMDTVLCGAWAVAAALDDD